MTQAAPSLKIRLAIATLIRDNLDDLLHPDGLNSFRDLIQAAQSTTYNYAPPRSIQASLEVEPASDKPTEKATTKKQTAAGASSDPGATPEKQDKKDAAPAAGGDVEPSVEDKQKLPEYQVIKKLVLELSEKDKGAVPPALTGRQQAGAIIAPAEKLVGVLVADFPKVKKALEIALGKAPADEELA